MRHVARLARLVGSVPQYSADATERCHITMAKEAYIATNHKDFEEQMCRYLDRIEKVHMFTIFLAYCAWHNAGEGQEFETAFLPRKTRNMFNQDEVNVPRNLTTAFIVTTRIPFGDVTIEGASALFQLPKLRSALLE